MNKMWTRPALLLLLAGVLAVTATPDGHDLELPKEERLIGAIVTSTTTLQTLRTTTVTQPLTCLSGGAATAATCMGRKRRRRQLALEAPLETPASDGSPELASSMQDGGADRSSAVARDPKLILFATRYVTRLTTFTTTFTSTDTNTTVSISVLCTFANVYTAFFNC